MQIEAKYDWVVILPDMSEIRGRTEAGILMASGMSEGVLRGEVVAVGIGKVLGDGDVIPPQTKVGAYVIFPADCEFMFMIGSQPYLAIKEEAIIAELERPTVIN